MLAAGQLLARTGSYFPDLSAGGPYLVANYPPVFIAAVAAGERALGPSLWFPRLLAILATGALVGALCAALGRVVAAGLLRRPWERLASDIVAAESARSREAIPTADRLLAAATALLFPLPWFVSTWAGLARVDTAAIAFSLAGLAVVLARGVTRRAWPALVLLWLAFFTKQNALLAPAAILLDLLIARDRRAVRAGLAYALPLAALLALLVAATHGQAFRHLVTYTAAAEYEPGRMAASYLQFAVVASPLLVLIAAALATVPTAFARGTGRVLLLYFALNAAALSTIAKAGAAQNYFLEPWAATILLGAFALRVLAERFEAVRAWRAAVLLLAAVVADSAYPSLDRLPQALRAPQNAGEFFRLTRMIRETPGDLLSENMSLLVVNRRPVLLEPFGVLLIARQGLFDTAPLAADCERGRFPLVVVEHRMWEIPALGDCLARRYEPFADLGPYQALRPRARGLPPR